MIGLAAADFSDFLFKTDVLVCPTRLAPRLIDLRADELAELMCAVQRVGRVVERVYKADGLTIACQVRYGLPLPFVIVTFVIFPLANI